MKYKKTGAVICQVADRCRQNSGQVIDKQEQCTAVFEDKCLTFFSLNTLYIKTQSLIDNNIFFALLYVLAYINKLVPKFMILLN